MADIHFEIFDNADFGNKNLRFSDAPAQEQRDFLKQNGYGFTTRYGGVWYPRTKEAKDRNADFVKEFAEKFYPENKKNFQPNQIEQLAESALENGSIEIKASIDNRIAYLENLIAELKEERKRDQEKISRLEAALENQTEENIAELEMRQEQAELDDETEWEKENTLTEAEERAYLEKQSEIKIPAETIELTSEILDSLHEAAEKESLADEPHAEKEILRDSEKSADDDLTVSPKELAIAKSVLPTVQYVSTLKFAQGEEREFFVNKIKEIAVAVENAPKINATDGLEEHRIVLRYFHPSGTQSFITEIGKDGDAFGFQCLNDDWDNAEWGYINLDELKNICGMEVDFHVPAGMTVEKFIQKEMSASFSRNDNFTEHEMLEEDTYIHSEEFISKFGDWNKANRLEKLRKAYSIEKDEKIILNGNDITSTVSSLIENEDRKGLQSLEKEIGRTILGTYQNDDTGIFVNVSNRNVTEISNHHYFFKEHIQSLAYIPEIIEKATFIAEVENEDKKKHPNIEKYLYFGTGLKLSGEDYTCKSVIGVDSSKNCYYDQSLSTIEKGSLVDYVMQNKKAGNLSPLMTQRETDLEGNEMPYVYYDKRLISVCQVPQLPYMEKLNEVWKPTKEAIELVKAGRLHIEKNGQEYVIIQANNETPVSELSSSELSRLSEEKYGFYFEYSDDENVADIYSAKDGDFVGSYGAGGFGYADDLRGNDPVAKIPEENFRKVLELAEIFYHKKAEEYENLIEAENGRMMNPDEFHKWNEEQKMQYSQENDERAAENADKDFETTKRLNEIVSEIKNSDFTLESKYENNLHSVALKNKDGTEIFSARENDSIVIPVEHTIAAWANDETSEKAKSLADEFFNLVCDDGIRGGDYVNAVFKNESPVYEEDFETDLPASNTSSVQQKEDAEITKEEIDREKQSIQKKIQQLKDELNNPENAEGGSYYDEQQDSDVRKITKRMKDFAKIENQELNQVLSENSETSYFIKSTAEFSQFEDFEPITNLSAKEAIKKYQELENNGVSCGIGINIKDDIVFDDPKAEGVTVLVRADGKDTLNIFGEGFVKELREDNQHSFNVLSAFQNLYSAAKDAGLEIEDASYIEEKKQEFIELLENSKTQNKKDYSLEEYWKNSASGMTMQDAKDGKVHIINIDKKETENVRSNLQSQDIAAPRTKSDLRKIREQCREILKKPDSEITESDKKILAQYEGGGGLNEEERTNSEVLNAFYTPDNLIEKVWELVDAYAPDAKTVLEPSAGVGKFANNRPNNKFSMHELDETSARINKILHPEADVIQGAFQKQFLDDGERFLKIGYEQPKHDVVIGNPPYGKYNDKYKGLGEGREFDRYEEYFIARGLDALKDENSVLAFVVPSGFLNTASDKQKSIIASKGEILDAYRLPEGTFSTTEVGTDILIMRKKESLDDRKNISGELLSDGEWFKNHPEKILGEIKTRTNRFGNEEKYVAVHEGLSVQDELNKIDGFLNQSIEKPGENHSWKMAEAHTEIQARNDRIHQLALDLGADEEKLKNMMSLNLNEGSLNEFGRYDDLKKTVDKAKAKAYFEKLEGTKIIPPKVNVKVDKLLREFILGGGNDLENSPQAQAANFVLEKLRAAGIEVVTDKEEFERILGREEFLQKMAGTLTPEEQRRYFTFNEADTAKFKSQVDEWISDKSNIAKLITVGGISPLFNALGIADNPIEVQYSTLSKMVRPVPQGYPNEAQGHALSVDDIYGIPSQLADPIMVFKSRTRSDSYVFFTERKDSQNRSILIPMAVNKHKGRIVINEITSMYGRNNEIDFVKTNIDEGNLIYVDKKRSTEWERSSHVQFVTQRLSNSNAYDINILTKERLVNFISADSQEKTPVQKMAVSSEEPENIESLFVSKNEENLDSEIDKLTEKDVNVWNDYINISTETPFIYKQFGLDDYPVNMYKQKLARALFLEKEKFGERLTHGHKGEFTSEDVKNVFKNIGNPRYIFNSKQDLNNPDNFYLIGVYDEMDEQGNPMMLSLHFDRNRKQVEANWVTSVYGKNKEILLNDWVKKGYLVYENDIEMEKAPEEVVALYMRVSNLQKPYGNNIKLKSDYVNSMGLFFSKRNKNVYGFAHEGKIYLNPDFMNSNVAVHEYTHLWDEYTRRTNPELWQKGMNIFKDTKFFNEVKSDPNYADIANDDNLVLSEVHARICGKMAEKILERIAKEDGEITKDKAIDWNEEVFDYAYDEFGWGRSSAFAKEKMNGYAWSVYSEFLASPLKDLMSGKNISLKKESRHAKPEKESPQSEKSETSQKEKSKWNITKSKGEVMSAEEFSHLYGRDFDEREFPIWKATDWQGNIDLSKLSGYDIQYLSESGKYVEKNFGEWTHKELFTSGDIYAKIQEQRELYVKSDGNRIFADNIKLLESAMKSPLEIEKIHFGVKTALAETFTVEHIDAEGNKVNLNLQESFILWAQNAKLADRKWRGDVDFATANISREELGEELTFYDIVNYIDGKPVKAEAVRGWRTYDMSEDEKAAEKAERRKEADLKRQARSDTANRLFDRYLHEGLSESDTKRLSAEYNRRFNSYVAPDYSKLPLFVDGMSAYKGDSKFKLYDQQIKGISFLCNKGNGLLAYDVGVGKTAAGIVATVNQIQTGRSKRPLIIVPNQVYSKWYTDIRQLFPNIKVNDLYNFGKDSVEKYIDSENLHRLNIPENSISLCTYEALKNITFTDESCENELYEDFASLLSTDMDGSARDNAESSDKIKGIIGSASHVKDESYFFYEDCGFDNLTVDEAHNFKNLWVVPRPKKKGESNEYAGIPSGKPSARALKMYGMTQLTQRRNDDRNVFMLTATPFTNSPTEVYSMLSYIGRERLKQAGITSLRAFFDEFAQTKQELGVTSTGNIDTKQVMKSWKELSALQNILTEFIDKVDGEEAGIIRPNKFTHVKPLDMSDLQKQMREIDEERMAEVKEGNSAAVIVAMNNMRLSCVAPALANPAMYPGVKLPPLSELVETSPKLKFVCDAIIDMYKDNPEKGQFMYVPLGKESHGIIKDYLVAHGIPKNAVEIINGEVNNSPEKKEKITSCFNDEKNPCKIIIGGRNTAEGIDLNGNSFVMYNCSLGWNPSETIQAEGRIWRQGNLQGNVHIVYPVMNDSIDSVLYQKHDEKRSRINELWNYKGDSLNVEDINPEDLKLDLIKDPNKKAKLILQEETKEARAELSRLNLKIKSFDEIIEKRKQLELGFSDAKEIVDYQKKQIESYKERGLEVPEWIKSELKDCNKKFSKAETGLEKVNEKLSSLKITDSEKEAEYIHSLNNQKHACEEKINNIEKTLPQILKKLEIERMEQKLIEYPVEKQREILEADILNNLRPMKEVEYEIKTMRHEAMLSAKLKAGEITESEFSLYKNAGYEKYEKWLNGEIESLEEKSVKNEAANENSFIKKENDIEKIIVYYDGHWADKRVEKGKGWKYQEKSFDNPKDALDFYRTAKIPKDVGAENKNGFRFNFMNPEERLLELISEHDKTVSVQNENVSENTAVEKPAQTDLEKAAEKTENAKQPEQDMDSLYADSGSLFFGFNDSDILSVHSSENEYRKSEPYDDFSITERQLTESELKRDEIIFPVLNGKESGMYKSFKDFAEHGVFDVQGKSVELDDSGRISGTGWNQLQSAMEIYRNKQFETFRYVLIGREDGEIKDQLAVKSYSPNRCAVSTPDLQTIKQVITRAEELDCMVAAVHNHPSGNTVESSFDAELTESLKRNLTNGNGLCRFAGHIILDHDTFNLYTPEKGWKMKLNSNAYGNSEDKLLNRNFAFLEDSVDYTWQLENVAKKINDKNNWNDNFIPVVFADSLNHVSGIKLYDKSFFDNEPQKIRNELQFSGLEANSVKAFPVITKNFAETMSAVDELLFEDKLKNLVEHSAFIDAALPESTVTEKFNILPGRQYFDVHGAKMRNPDIEATWQTRINPALFSEPEQKTMRKKEVAFER